MIHHAKDGWSLMGCNLRDICDDHFFYVDLFMLNEYYPIDYHGSCYLHIISCNHIAIFH